MPIAKVRTVQLRLPPLHPLQRQFVTDPHRIVVAAAGTKTGKLVALSTPVPTPSGWRTVADLCVGDFVFDDAGLPTRIDYVSPVQVDTVCYRVKFMGGEEIVADAGHLWAVECYRSAKTSKRLAHEKDECLMTTQQMVDAGVARMRPSGYARYRFRVKNTAPLQYRPDDAELPIDPYLLGCWLGDGGKVAARFTSADPEIIEAFRLSGFPMRQASRYNYQICYVEHGETRNRWTSALRGLGVYGNKHVPHAYMTASVAQRIALLRGLMDTDGFCGKGHDRNGGRRSAEFYNTNEQLARQTIELVAGLGGNATIREKRARLNGKDCGICYRLTVRTPFNPFKLERKASRYRIENGFHRAITSIEPVESVPVKCIRVESPSHLYLVSRSCIPTHNTFGLSEWLIYKAWNTPGSLNWWTAPTYRQSKIAFKLIGDMMPRGRFNASKSDLMYELTRTDGSVYSRIEFKSGDKAESLRGEGVHNVVVDEAGYWQQDSFVSVWTTLTKTRGNMRIISTPKGRNWFYSEWCKGWDPALRKRHPEYWSYQLPTASNPFVPRAAIEEARKNLPNDVFRQEFLAEFLDESAGVFRNLKGCLTSRFQAEPTPGVTYVMGVDWAKHEDYTVLMIADAGTRKIVHIERFNQLDWNIQIDRAVRKARHWNNASMIMDSTGVGDVPFDQVASVYPYVQAYQISNTFRKTALIQKLQFAMENGQIGYYAEGPNADVLMSELTMYGFTLTAHGNFVFSAPDGYHDDTVVALALTTWLLTGEPYVYKFSNRRGV